MFGPGPVAALALAASVGAPALAPRTDWVGETVFARKPGVLYGKVEPDGTFTPLDKLRSIQYVVVRDEKGRLQVTQDGKPVWINKDDMVRLKDGVQHAFRRGPCPAIDCDVIGLRPRLQIGGDQGGTQLLVVRRLFHCLPSFWAKMKMHRV